MPEIVEWAEIADQYGDTLLLGNGASMALHSGFGYGSLFDSALENGHITPPVATIFEQFGVTDFELVLRRLWQASLVTQALEIPNGRVQEAYAEVRDALISTVRDVHVDYDDALPHLSLIYRFMARFDTVISMNGTVPKLTVSRIVWLPVRVISVKLSSDRRLWLYFLTAASTALACTTFSIGCTAISVLRVAARNVPWYASWIIASMYASVRDECSGGTTRW